MAEPRHRPAWFWTTTNQAASVVGGRRGEGGQLAVRHALGMARCPAAPGPPGQQGSKATRQECQPWGTAAGAAQAQAQAQRMPPSAAHRCSTGTAGPAWLAGACGEGARNRVGAATKSTLAHMPGSLQSGESMPPFPRYPHIAARPHLR